MNRKALAVGVLLLGLAGCSKDPKTDGGHPPAVADNGQFAVLAGDGFHSDGSFDPRMTCDGSGDYSPPLVFRHVPAGTAELLLSMVDDDKTSPQGDPLIHWVQWKIPATATGLAEHTEPPGAREALSDLGEATYNGPCPPAGQTHHYRFTLLALSKPIDLPNGTAARKVLEAAEPLVTSTADFVATYKRS
ncbi:PBP family phospholipid-binding protein [Kribbella voronezhensis]|uniref:PBP family phospholipid-binding protein n=1 Tax=Kribbella voronezhensis TaxID=2512212 RepID=A0A4R7TDF6_9ACTN|nr:YbhB/YbcL family Raf kinase inhibitor-like protein [Kribbella voronezhensis]TDU89377.1 PBP family phospholipid-binding protein [Kribbella voronezhensis]